jgi:hypothetical protein
MNLTSPIQFTQTELATLYHAVYKRLLELTGNHNEEERKVLHAIRVKIAMRL